MNRVVAGEPFGRFTRADNINNIIDGARQGALGMPSTPELERWRDPDFIRIKNNTGSVLDSFAVVEVSTAVVTSLANLAQFQRMPCAYGIVPTGTNSRAAILVQPLGVDAIGMATVSGLTPVQLLVNHPTDTFATPIIGVTDALQSAASGSYEIIYKDSAASGSGSSSSGPYVWAWVRYCGDGQSNLNLDVEVVTGVTCVGGFMQVTTETVRIPGGAIV